MKFSLKTLRFAGKYLRLNATHEIIAIVLRFFKCENNPLLPHNKLRVYLFTTIETLYFCGYHYSFCCRLTCECLHEKLSDNRNSYSVLLCELFTTGGLLIKDVGNQLQYTRLLSSLCSMTRGIKGKSREILSSRDALWLGWLSFAFVKEGYKTQKCKKRFSEITEKGSSLCWRLCWVLDIRSILIYFSIFRFFNNLIINVDILSIFCWYKKNNYPRLKLLRISAWKSIILSVLTQSVF